MSEGADVVRRQFEVLGSEGLDAAAAFWHPDIEWRAVEGAADDVGVMCGADRLRRYYEDWLETFDDLRAEVVEIVLEDGDDVVLKLRNSGRGRVSGVETHGSYYVACTVRDGRIVSGREFDSRGKALKAAGSGRQ
jgi:ketosteroid isomerase-like protein